MVQQGDLQFGFGLTSGVNGFNSLRGGSLYPVLSVKDDFIWQRGRHNFAFGVESATEIDHYYNNQFVPYVGVNYISSGDPVTNSLVNSLSPNAPASAAGDVEGLYATLTGRMTYYSLGQFVNTKTKQFQPGISFDCTRSLTRRAVLRRFLEDEPTITLNLGLRWDFTGASKDETGFYTHPTVADLWGPTGVGQLFQPGSLTGDQNPVEGPQAESYSQLMCTRAERRFCLESAGRSGNSDGQALRQRENRHSRQLHLQELHGRSPEFLEFRIEQWSKFHTYYYANPVAPGGGHPSAGILQRRLCESGRLTSCAYINLAIAVPAVIPEVYQAFSGTGYLTFDPHIKQPYVESWQVGIQRQLSANNVLEVRYVGMFPKINGWCELQRGQHL